MIALYLDAAAVIYLIEGSSSIRAQVHAHIEQAEKAPAGRLLASRLSRLECRVKPLRTGDTAMLATYDAFFTRARSSTAVGQAIDRAFASSPADTRTESEKQFQLEFLSMAGALLTALGRKSERFA